MAQILVLYPHPPDPEAFDRHYFESHAKLARRIPGLRRLEVSRGTIISPQGPSPYHLIVQLNFDSLAALDAGLASPESRLASEDLVNFATEGRRPFIFDTQIL